MKMLPATIEGIFEVRMYVLNLRPLPQTGFNRQRAVESCTVSVNAGMVSSPDCFVGVAGEAKTDVDDTTPAKRESGPCLAIGLRRRSTNAADADDDARTISSGDGLGEG